MIRRETEKIIEIYKEFGEKMGNDVKKLFCEAIIESEKQAEGDERVFEISGKPQGKGRPRFTRNKNGCVLGVFTPEKTAVYEKEIQWAYLLAHRDKEIIQGPVALEVIAVLPVAKSESKKLKERKLGGVVPPTVKPDVDNVAKIIMDGLNGVAYADDKQVTELFVSKCYGEEAKTIVKIKPRAVLRE